MKKYEVYLISSTVSTCTVKVEAESEEDATRIALETVLLQNFKCIKIQDGIEIDWVREVNSDE